MSMSNFTLALGGGQPPIDVTLPRSHKPLTENIIVVVMTRPMRGHLNLPLLRLLRLEQLAPSLSALSSSASLFPSQILRYPLWQAQGEVSGPNQRGYAVEGYFQTVQPIISKLEISKSYR